MGIRAIIVDDVELARERIRILLDDSEVEVIAECANGREAIEAIQKHKPDLVFLDIQMPQIGGFEVVEKIGAEKMPAVIFVTAYDEFAIRAFEVNADDYLLKPFDVERLKKAVERAKREIERQIPQAEIEERLRRLLEDVKIEPKYLKRIPVKTVRGTILISIEEVEWIGAAGNYLELHIGSDTHLIREQLSKIELKLDPRKFIRIHRSTIVRVDSINFLYPLFNGDQVIVLKNGQELNLSRTYHEKLMTILEGK